MNNLNQNAIDGINNLIARNNDAGSGFVEVANNINYVHLTKWLIDWAKTHENYATELQSLVAKHGGEPEDSTTIMGELHHAWIDLKAQFTNNDTEALLNECIRGEEQAFSDYKEVMAEESLSPDVQSILNRQQFEIKKGIDQLKSLKNSYKQFETAS